MVYGTDPAYFTQDADPVLAKVLHTLIPAGKESIRLMVEDGGLRILATMTWQLEMEARLSGDTQEQEITQFELAILTKHLMHLADHVGVYAPNIWAVFAAVTNDPCGPMHEQHTLAPDDPSLAEQFYIAAYAEIDRIEFAASMLPGAGSYSPDPFGELIKSTTSKTTRYKPPACGSCGSADTFVSTTRKRWRHIKCNNCANTFKDTTN